MRKFLQAWAIRRMINTPPDFIVGGAEDPYLLRWWVIPRNKFFNIYLHRFLRSDDDRALHDHPWCNLSLLIDGSYTEHTIQAGGIHRAQVLHAGDWRLRLSGKLAHRIELHQGACTTLFFTGPVYREWGFHCQHAGWVPWQKFVDARDKGAVGLGCDQP